MPQHDQYPYPPPDDPRWGQHQRPQQQVGYQQPQRGHAGHAAHGPYPDDDRGHYQPPRPEPRNGLGLAALILGLVGVLFGLVPLTGFVAVALGITGAALGLAGYGRVRRGRANNGKVAISGTVVSVAALALGIWGIVITFGAVDQLGEDLENLGGSPVDAAEATSATVPAGQLVEVGDWRVSVQASNLDAAAVITGANQFAEPPPDGTRYVMARADVAYTGAESGEPWLDLQFRILGGAGNTFDAANADCGPLPSSLLDVGEMAGGAAAAGNICRAVPADQLEGAVWVIDETIGGARAYVALQ